MLSNLKHLETNKAIFLERTNLIQNRTVHRKIAQRNDARAKNNNVGQKEDQRNFPKERGNGKLPRPLFIECLFPLILFL